MAKCLRCGSFTKRKNDVCKMCRSIYKVSNQFGVSLEQNKDNWALNNKNKGGEE